MYVNSVDDIKKAFYKRHTDLNKVDQAINQINSELEKKWQPDIKCISVYLVGLRLNKYEIDKLDDRLSGKGFADISYFFADDKLFYIEFYFEDEDK